MSGYSLPSYLQKFDSPYYQQHHIDFQAYCHKLVEDNISPYVHDWDEQGEIPDSIYRLLGTEETGLFVLFMGYPYPTEYLKINDKTAPIFKDVNIKIDTFHELIFTEELSRCGSAGLLWGVTAGLTIGLPPVLRFGMTQEKKEKERQVISDCLSGRRKICLAITEPTAGSDVANIKCSAKDDGQGNYIVNGEKKWITNGIWADYFTVAVRTGGPGMGGISLLLIERTMPGVTTKRMKCSGVWCSGTTFITFDNVKVPKSHLLGNLNQGFKLIMFNFNHERFWFIGQTLRFARVCLEECFSFAQRRKTFGKKLIDHPVIRLKLAEMSRQVEGTQNWTEWLAYNLNSHSDDMDHFNKKMSGHTALLKAHSTKVFEYCSREACQIFGGASYTRGGVGEKVERLAREVRAMAIPGGSEEILLDLGVKQQIKYSASI